MIQHHLEIRIQSVCVCVCVRAHVRVLSLPRDLLEQCSKNSDVDVNNLGILLKFSSF